jgi:hypothetical protein
VTPAIVNVFAMLLSLMKESPFSWIIQAAGSIPAPWHE